MYTMKYPAVNLLQNEKRWNKSPHYNAAGCQVIYISDVQDKNNYILERKAKWLDCTASDIRIPLVHGVRSISFITDLSTAPHIGWWRLSMSYSKCAFASNKRNSTLFPTGILAFFHKNESLCTIFKQRFTYQIQYSTKQIQNEQLKPICCHVCSIIILLLLYASCNFTPHTELH